MVPDAALGVRRESILIILSTGYTIGCLSAIGLHLILPMDVGGEDMYVHAIPQDPTMMGTDKVRTTATATSFLRS